MNIRANSNCHFVATIVAVSLIVALASNHPAAAQGRRGARGGATETTTTPAAAPADDGFVKANYTKYEYKIPMRDGVKLHTAVYVPKDATADHKYPILMTRTPYSARPYGVDQYPATLGPSAAYMREKFIFVTQDVRGCWMSEGEFVDIRPHIDHKEGPKMVDEASDTWDAVDWLVKNVPYNNGRVGQSGISYPGFYTAAGMIDAHPALKASSPQAPLVDWFTGDDWHHNGALWLSHSFNFEINFGRPRPEPVKVDRRPRFDHETQDGYKFFLDMGPLRNAEAKYMRDVAFWKDIMAHDTMDDFWRARNLRPHLKNIKPAVLTVGGWFDAEDLFGTLETYRNVERMSPDCENTIVMGPWVHGGWSRGQGDLLGDVAFNAPTGEFYREKIELPFFLHYLKEKDKDYKRPEAWMFQTGTNQWHEYEAWPPKGSVTMDFYLGSSGRVSTERPKAGAGELGYDEYWSNPNRPVPTMEGTAIGMPREYMTADQRFASRRPDVLVYQTDILMSDLVVAGPIEVELVVSTSGTDSDWVVKLIDVYPNDMAGQPANAQTGLIAPSNPTDVKLGGYQQLVRGDVFRGKFRNSFEKPEPFVPDQPTIVKFTMPDICHAFRPGHRLMVQIQSSWFPLSDRNPQKFVNINTAGPEDFVSARQRVYRDAEHATRLRLPVLP